MQQKLLKVCVIIYVTATSLLAAPDTYAAGGNAAAGITIPTAPNGGPTSNGHQENYIDRVFLWAEDEFLHYFSQFCEAAAFVALVSAVFFAIRRDFWLFIGSLAALVAALYFYRASGNPNGVIGGIVKQLPS